jgi:hypothetical protein
MWNYFFPNMGLLSEQAHARQATKKGHSLITLHNLQRRLDRIAPAHRYGPVHRRAIVVRRNYEAAARSKAAIKAAQEMMAPVQPVVVLDIPGI